MSLHWLYRSLFLILCSITYTIITLNSLTVSDSLLYGVGCGLFVGATIIAMEHVLSKQSGLKKLNAIIIGIFVGSLLGEVILIPADTIFHFEGIFSPVTFLFLKASLFLTMIYFAVAIALKAEEEGSLANSLVQVFKNRNKKEIVADISILLDTRIVDIANSGLIDNLLIIPRFVVNELYKYSESHDETVKNKGKKGLEVLKKLENMPLLHLSYSEKDYPQFKDPILKLIYLAHHLKANIITADLASLQQYPLEHVRVINLQNVATAFKSITGDQLSVKIQRFGKEPRQGVGYLEDGTMVVVNGGAEYIGEIIRTHVLSIKHTTSGRIIFCNANNEGLQQPIEQTLSHASVNMDNESLAKNYFL